MFLAATTYLNPDEVMHASTGFQHSGLGLWKAAFEWHHPPLLVVLVGWMGNFSLAEWWLRLIPVLAGTFASLFAGLWAHRLTGDRRAAWICGCIILFAPNLILLSAQLRGYSLALCFGALALWALEGVFVNPGWRTVAQFTTFLFLALLSEYNAAWLAAGSGVYVLLRWRDLPATARKAWVGGQLACAALCCFLLLATIWGKIHETSWESMATSYLSSGFPAVGQNWLSFSVVGLVKQFAYLFGSSVSAVLGLILFAIAIVTLPWRTGALFLVPFLGANAAALLRMFPYGRLRHSSILALFIAAGLGVAWVWLVRRIPRYHLALAAVLVGFVAITFESDSLNNIPYARHQLTSMNRGLAEMRRQIPFGTTILVDQETAYVLGFYLYGRNFRLQPQDVISPTTPYSLQWHSWNQFQIPAPSSTPVWIADTGFTIALPDSFRTVRREPAVSFNFDDALVFVRFGPQP